jgi:hypothetical protein
MGNVNGWLKPEKFAYLAGLLCALLDKAEVLIVSVGDLLLATAKTVRGRH